LFLSNEDAILELFLANEEYFRAQMKRILGPFLSNEEDLRTVPLK